MPFMLGLELKVWRALEGRRVVVVVVIYLQEATLTCKRFHSLVTMMKPANDTLDPTENNALLTYLLGNVNSKIDWEDAAKCFHGRSSKQLRSVWEATEVELRRALADLRRVPEKDIVLFKIIEIGQKKRRTRRRNRSNHNHSAAPGIQVYRFDDSIFREKGMSRRRLLEIMRDVQMPMSTKKAIVSAPKNKKATRLAKTVAKLTTTMKAAKRTTLDPLEKSTTSAMASFSPSENSWILNKLCNNQTPTIDWDQFALYCPNRSAADVQKHWETAEDEIRHRLAKKWSVSASDIRVLHKCTLVKDATFKWRLFDKHLDEGLPRTLKVALRFDTAILSEVTRAEILEIMNGISMVHAWSRKRKVEEESTIPPGKKPKTQATAGLSTSLSPPPRAEKSLNSPKLITPDSDKEEVCEQDYRTRFPKDGPKRELFTKNV